MSRAIRNAVAREAYRDRDESLRLIGFTSYGAYLRSPLWEIVRERAFAIHGRSCRRCTAPATVVHHATYSRETLTGEDVRGLIPICGRCAKATSLTSRNDDWARKDGRRIRALGDTNAMLMKPIEPRTGPAPKGPRCFRCGRPRKIKKQECGRCLKRTKAMKLDINSIRAASSEYAYGDRR